MLVYRLGAFPAFAGARYQEHGQEASRAQAGVPWHATSSRVWHALLVLCRQQPDRGPGT